MAIWDAKLMPPFVPMELDGAKTKVEGYNQADHLVGLVMPDLRRVF